MMQNPPPSIFFEKCEQSRLVISPGQLERLERYVSRLLEVNRHMNLTAVRDAEGVWIRHVYDSLALLPHLRGDLEQRALDLGSGGGLPGIPLAVLRPDMAWTLVDSVAKKARFLEETAAEIGLLNVRVDTRRAEVLGRDPDFRERFHVVTARAVARLPTLLELTVPLLRVKGRLYAMKGQQASEELKEARRAMERLSVEPRLEEDTPEGGRLLIFKKVRETAKAYPRAVGIPNKEPL
ncbi:MAG: 16S rRNA (guanine(527)-N(7))-methyltransferase RsmG [Kiritimatiellae bacterium]|nr:16S rRNA (guanine(527)-N(7))-methyltransferase RsmG [Kiritimatiellia bacterium]